jgi:hypothetical protein
MKPILLATLIPALAAGFSAGCTGSPAPVRPETSGLSPAVNYAPLREVLRASVTRRGLLVPLGVRETRASLETQLGLLALTGPTETPDLFSRQEDLLAYWYNARTAWALYLSLLHDFEDRLADQYIREREFFIDGRWMTLRGIDSLLSEFDDYRVVVAAPGVSEQRARLPREVFLPEKIRETIEERFNEFVADPDRFRIDIACREIRIPCVLWSVRDRVKQAFRRRYGRQEVPLRVALAWQVQGKARRRLEDAVGFRSVRAGNAYCLAEILE